MALATLFSGSLFVGHFGRMCSKQADQESLDALFSAAYSPKLLRGSQKWNNLSVAAVSWPEEREAFLPRGFPPTGWPSSLPLTTRATLCNHR
jgi:hypothetical protein